MKYGESVAITILMLGNGGTAYKNAGTDDSSDTKFWRGHCKQFHMVEFLLRE